MAEQEHWFKGAFVHRTARAVLIRLDYDDAEHWFPELGIIDMTDGELKRGERVDVQLAGWLAAKEGLL